MGSQDQHARLFTLEEAQTLVHEIEPLVAEIKAAFRKIRREITEASRATGIPPSNPRLSARIEERGVATPLVERVNNLIRRINEKGCVVNGPEAGLVDFPALLGSEIVLLCWRHGETGISHYHRIPEGFAGRKPLLDTRKDSASSTIH